VKPTNKGEIMSTRATLTTEHAEELYSALCDLLEHVKGNRGPRDGNPYLVPEVKSALQVVANVQGVEDYLDAETGER
jgi:hypothetical protein